MFASLASRSLRNKGSIIWFSSFNLSRFAHSLPFATVKAEEVSGSQPTEVLNLVQGNWTSSSSWNTIPDPLNGESFIKVAEVNAKEIQVAIITPFNFPLEIPLLQLMGALYMGNKPILKVDSKAKPRMTLFTGSSRVAEKLAVDLSGRIKVEDAGFDWKVLGPDVQQEDYIAWVCDQDAYACSGQKCSAQSMLFIHENWSKSSFLEKLSGLAARRKLDDLTVGPVLTVTTQAMLDHLNKLLKINGSKLLFGGEALQNHSIPAVYGAIKPTAVFVPLEEILEEENYDLVTKEIFGPFQVVTEYKHNQLPLVLKALEKMHAHLTAAVVSNDPLFVQDIIGNSVNGTTYVGLRARTTGAPQNHWFGPAGDPRGAGIGTPEAIKLVWSCHREVIYDVGPVSQNWRTPQPT
ncbi:aldehyde dehydrogenase 12A1 [Perilla frutescens var. hirtella]|uniref:Aldehyde dehydrogenase 12A1 n=1 Tax=Perilla frutescens var. hirtella TaxID=608512 RepID=A0AAD4P091_PERFH|nr:aldehyde dehydrogenase 12A1 [Perilla frutescens var. hirtella]